MRVIGSFLASGASNSSPRSSSSLGSAAAGAGVRGNARRRSDGRPVRHGSAPRGPPEQALVLDGAGGEVWVAVGLSGLAPTTEVGVVYPLRSLAVTS